jgi:mannose-6-phosphate isomerase-like protein (cupin superfamily)
MVVCPTVNAPEAGHDTMLWDALHLGVVSRQAQEFDVIHNYGNLLPATCSHLLSTPMVTTVCEPVPPALASVATQGGAQYYVAASAAGRYAPLEYLDTIHPGVAVDTLPFRDQPGAYVAFCGRLTAESGVASAIDIARQCQMPLCIAGPLVDPAFFHSQVEPQLLPGRVEYRGSLAPAACSEFLANAGALLQPCQTPKSFSLSTVEAMACGTPVVAYAVGVMPELVADGETGFLVADSAKAVAGLQRVTELNRQRCRQWVEERFSVERMAAAYVDVYTRIIARENSHARHAAPPWGRWEVLLDEPSYKVKRITVLPNKRLSYQKHFKREEYWTIVQGQALVTLDGCDTSRGAGETIHIPYETAHRIANPGPHELVFIEVQRGTYFGEDDIVRLQDDYGRDRP